MTAARLCPSLAASSYALKHGLCDGQRDLQIEPHGQKAKNSGSYYACWAHCFE